MHHCEPCPPSPPSDPPSSPPPHLPPLLPPCQASGSWWSRGEGPEQFFQAVVRPAGSQGASSAAAAEAAAAAASWSCSCCSWLSGQCSSLVGSCNGSATRRGWGRRSGWRCRRLTQTHSSSGKPPASAIGHSGCACPPCQCRAYGVDFLAGKLPFRWGELLHWLAVKG